MAETRRRCRYCQTQMQAQERQNQMQALEWPWAAVVAPLVVQEQQLAAVAQPLVVQVPLAAMEPQTQRPRRPQATGPQSPPSAELCEQERA